MNRETWLINAADKLKPDFEKVSAPFPPVRISVGFPGGRGNRRKAIGQYWTPKSAVDGIPHIFVSPILGDAVEVLSTLVHELAHAATPGAGHGKAFRRVALAVGLTGKMTETVASDALKGRLNDLIKEIGDYPHGALNPSEGPKKDGTRMLKASCDCGYTVRITRKWLDLGCPICPACAVQMTEGA